MLARSIFLALILFSSASAQQLALKELVLRADPAGVAIRPLDSIPVQALYYGQNGNNTQEIAGTATFWYLPWWFIILFLIVLALVLFYGWKAYNWVRGKFGKAPKRLGRR